MKDNNADSVCLGRLGRLSRHDIAVATIFPASASADIAESVSSIWVLFFLLLLFSILILVYEEAIIFPFFSVRQTLAYRQLCSTLRPRNNASLVHRVKQKRKKGKINRKPNVHRVLDKVDNMGDVGLFVRLTACRHTRPPPRNHRTQPKNGGRDEGT